MNPSRGVLAAVILGILLGSAIVTIPHYTASYEGQERSIAPTVERPYASVATTENRPDIRIVVLVGLSFLVAVVALTISRRFATRA